MAQRVTDLILNGDFSIGSVSGDSDANWANWINQGPFSVLGQTSPAFDGTQTATLSYTGLEGLDTGPGANGAGRLSLDVSWGDGTTAGGAETELQIVIAGLTLAVITTPAGDGTTATVTYLNGASGNLTSISESTASTLVLDLPSGIGSAGALNFVFAPDVPGSSDSIVIDNVSLEVTETVPDSVDAVDDPIGVLESEGAGDTDGNALANDTVGSGLVTEVDGSALNVGVAVAGSGGGTFTIDAAGNVDFDAAGAFESLGAGETATTSVSYTIEEQTPFDPGAQTVQTAAEVGAADQRAFFTFNAGEFSNDGTTQVSGTISLSEVTQPRLNVLFIMDESGSTSNNFGGTVPGDQNGDGDDNDVIDAEIASFINLRQAIDGLGFGDDAVDLGLVVFDTEALVLTTAGGELAAEQDSDYTGQSILFEASNTTLDGVLATRQESGQTNFDDALDAAIAWFRNSNAEIGHTNIIYFLSDGVPTIDGTDFSNELAVLASEFNAGIVAIGVGSGSDVGDPNDPDDSDLDTIDNTGGAQQVTSTDDLNTALLGSPFQDVDPVDFRIFVDGVQDTSFTVADLIETPLGFTFNAATLSGITEVPGAVSLVRVEVEFDDGTVLTNLVEVEAQPQSSDTANVTVTVTGENDPPDAVDDAAGAGATATVDVDVLANDSDPDATDVLGIASFDAAGTLGGAITLDDNATPDPADDVLAYDPNGAFEGLGAGETAVDTFTYTVTDGNGGTDTATVFVTVTGANDAPDAVDDAATVGEDAAAATPIDVLDNDSDPDTTDVLGIASFDAAGTLGGAVTLDDNATPDPADDVLAYDPNGAFEGLGAGETAVDTFTYTVTDGNGGTDTATVFVTVTGANDAPDAVDDAAGVASDATVNVVVTANDSDPDVNDDLEILSLDTTGTQGIVTPVGDGDGVTYDPNGAFDALGQGETGIDTFTYTVTDGNGATDTATVTVTVTGVNDPPDAVDDLTLGFQDTPTAYNVLVNDSDPNNDSLTVTGATLVTAGAGVVSFDPGGSVTLTPTMTFTGPAEIDYTISDGRGATDTATLTINVIPNALPVIQEPISFQVEENTALAANLQGTDPEGDPLTWSIIGGADGGLFSINSSTGALSFLTPPDFELPSDANLDNRYNVRVELADPYGAVTQAVLVTVTDVPDGEPVAVDDITIGFQGQPLVGFDVLANDSDPDGDPLEVISAQLVDPLLGSVAVNPDETITFTPEPLTTGAVEILYAISDGLGGTDSATLTVNVIANGAPTISEPVSFEVFEDQSLAANLQANDPENDPLTWSIVGGADAALFAIDANTGQLNFLVPPDFENPLDQGGDNQYQVMVQVADDFGSNSQNILVTVLDVAPPNEPPVFTSPPSLPGVPAVITLNGQSGVGGQPIATVAAADPNVADTLVYTLFGEDEALFTINPTTGELGFADPNTTGQTIGRSFDGDRIYELDVLVTDGNGGSDILDLDLPLFLGG